MTFRQLRQRSGFPTATALADAADQNVSTILKIETGRVPDPRYSTITALAAALGVEPAVVKRAITATVRRRRREAAAA
jgi:transcriptional regulator with XRE-family HTH domain